VTQCYCEQCTKDPLKTYTERFRHVAECKEMAAKFYGKERDFEAYMAGAVKLRGQAGADKLRNGVKFLWENVK